MYLAQDTKLDRKVALKILPLELSADQYRMRRFVQEAKSASALNHPNIITIYEIETINSIRFIATEFIDGETLREHIRRAPLKPAAVLDIAIQIVSALSAAHEVGIVHRDIKPDNIMLRRDGIVKLLDFGLAKLTDPSPLEPEAPTRVAVKTEPGTVMGTAIYMSPEQARGFSLDARTDIFSLGVVLYETVTGHLPFEGSTSNEVLAVILSEKEPQPLARFTRDVPIELERIVEKTLRKNRDERYQTVKDLLLDLKTLKEELEFDRKLERSITPQLKRAPETGAAETTTSRPAPTDIASVPITTKSRRRSVVLIVALLVLALAAGVYMYLRSAGGSINSVAVLPFDNASNDPNLEYLSDGIPEALINSLTELQQLRVIARTTAFRYKRSASDPQQVGRELNVRAVLMGRVSQRADTLNIQVDLVDTATGSQLWGQEYERKLSEVLSIKQEIAREVTNRLRLRLSGDEQRHLIRRDTTNAEAYQFYLRGRFYWAKRTAEGIRLAIEQFQQAIDRDPNYALGYAGLADCYALQEEYAGLPASETLPKARAAAERALQIDDSLSEVLTTSAFIDQRLWRWAEAEEGSKRAISANPNYPTAHHWFSIYLLTRRRFDDALTEIKRAQELDTLSPVIGSNVANLYLLKNELSQAIEECNKVIELDPSFGPIHEHLGFIYLKQQRYDEATAEFQKAVELSKRASLFLMDLGYCYGVANKRTEALQIAKELEEKYARHEAAGYQVAGVYVGLASKDQAFAWLEKDFQQHSGYLPNITWRLNFENLRSDARYVDLLRRMGLQP